MIELKDAHALEFSFPDVHPQARLRVFFQRTFRIPDDDKTYPLPPGLGNFPLAHLDDYADRVPEPWLRRGGVMLPMYQSEALWVRFSPDYVKNQGAYPFALKVAAGKINAVSGGSWSEPIRRNPQDYLVIPGQPWLDGFCVDEGVIRQFVAMPLGSGYSAEEQLTGQAEVGGMQLIAYPMKRRVFEERFPYKEPSRLFRCCCRSAAAPGAAMGLAAGGKMKQQIFADPYHPDDWDTQNSRCFVHIVNSLCWREYTGKTPPYPPVTAREYERAGLPWFDYYREDLKAVEGSSALGSLQSVAQMSQQKGDVLTGNETVKATKVIPLSKHQVREGEF